MNIVFPNMIFVDHIGLILFEAKMIRCFEHPTFQTIYKEIELNFNANCAYDHHLTNSICPHNGFYV
jgi:hypothetical protein